MFTILVAIHQVVIESLHQLILPSFEPCASSMAKNCDIKQLVNAENRSTGHIIANLPTLPVSA